MQHAPQFYTNKTYHSRLTELINVGIYLLPQLVRNFCVVCLFFIIIICCCCVCPSICVTNIHQILLLIFVFCNTHTCTYIPQIMKINAQTQIIIIICDYHRYPCLRCISTLFFQFYFYFSVSFFFVVQLFHLDILIILLLLETLLLCISFSLKPISNFGLTTTIELWLAKTRAQRRTTKRVRKSNKQQYNLIDSTSELYIYINIYLSVCVCFLLIIIIIICLFFPLRFVCGFFYAFGCRIIRLSLLSWLTLTLSSIRFYV